MTMTKRKGFLGILLGLALVLALGLLPGMASKAHAGIPPTISIDVNTETQDHIEDLGWSYDKDTKTLTLNGYSFDDKEVAGSGVISIDDYYNDYTISLVGNDNTIKTTTAGKAGIFASGNIKITGSGTLTVTATQYGIRSTDKSVTIQSGTVTATGTDGTGLGGRPVLIEGGTVTATGKSNGIQGNAVEIKGGTVKATGTGDNSKGIYCPYGIKISGGAVTASGKTYGIDFGAASTFTGGNITATGETSSGIYSSGGTLTIDGGTVTATSGGDAGVGIYTSSYVVTIKKGSNVVASGASSGIGSIAVINELAGTGWTNKEGTEGKAPIPVSAEAQSLEKYRKVQFPEVKDPATVTKAPAAKTLVYTGTAQELVTSGEAKGGTMEYALGKDDKTAPADGWGASVPKGTDIGTYHVWYRVAGDDDHEDVAPAHVGASIGKVAVTGVTINKESIELSVGGAETLVATVAPSDATDQSLDWNSSDVSVATVDSLGEVRGVAEGTATVTVRTMDGGKTASCSVTVKAEPKPEPKPEPEPGAVEMFRLYNPNSGEHFYTADDNERAYLASIGWQEEGIGWMAPAEGAEVYRLYNAYAGDHHYTLDANERDYLVSAGWTDEGVGWCSAGEDGVPLYRQYNPNAKGAGSHNYTADKDENDYLVSVGWQEEGIGWYGVAADTESDDLVAASAI